MNMKWKWINENDKFEYTNKEIYGKLIAKMPNPIYGVDDKYSKFKIGDNVEVVDSGQIYSGYRAMAKAMDVEDCWLGEDNYNHVVEKNGRIGVVVSMKIHEDRGSVVLGVLIDQGIIIIDDSGIRNSQISMLEEELFEI